MTKQSKRLLSLDVMRGLTIALMIVVNNQVGSGRMFPFLNHALWDGLSFADLVFPSFMFIMGVSAAFSLNKVSMRKSRAAWKSTFRGLKIILVGILLTWIARGVWGVENLLEFETLRLTGVLVRLGICYIFASLIYIAMGPTKKTIITIAAILAAYGAILVCFNGLCMSEDNVIARIDRALIGCGHMYHKHIGGDVRICFDPEGLLSDLPGIAHVLIGMLCGNIILRGKTDLWKVVARLSLIGGGLMIFGFILNPILPINKNLWTPSFVFATCGGAAMTLAILLWMLDIRRMKAAWLVGPTCVFGLNPLVLYCFSYLLEEFVWKINIHGMGFPDWFSRICGGDEFGSLAYSLLLVLICWLVGLPLYLKKIVVKL